MTSSIYGPVKSWRLGASLGVDVLCVDSICSFECVYCQLGKIHRVTSAREVFVSTAQVLEDLRNSDWQTADVVTFSGSGEPTLAKNLGEIIEKIKELTGKPVIVLTNSTLLHLAEVRRELAGADKIFCKLDAWSDESLRKIDRPATGVSFEKIVRGIRLLRAEFKGFLAIQTMILRQPKDADITRLAEILVSVKPDEVQLNTPSRPIPQDYFTETRGNEVLNTEGFTCLRTVSKETLEDVRKKLENLTNLPIITR